MMTATLGDKWTLLHWSARLGAAHCAQLLLATRRVDYTAVDWGGYTPLHVAGSPAVSVPNTDTGETKTHTHTHTHAHTHIHARAPYNIYDDDDDHTCAGSGDVTAGCTGSARNLTSLGTAEQARPHPGGGMQERRA